MLRRHPIVFAYVFSLALWGALALQLRAEPVAPPAASSGNAAVYAEQAAR